MVVAVFVAIYSNVGKVLGNPSSLPIATNCVLGGEGTATTSPRYINAGNATSTLSCDSYTLSSNNIVPTAMSSAVLLLQYAGSSTSAILNTNIEFSNDNIDWYQNNLLDYMSTTTPIASLNTTESMSWTFSSTTAGGGRISNSTATSTRAVSIPVPTRYVRAVFTVPIGAAAGAVWAQIIPKKEAANY